MQTFCDKELSISLYSKGNDLIQVIKEKADDGTFRLVEKTIVSLQEENETYRDEQTLSNSESSEKENLRIKREETEENIKDLQHVSNHPSIFLDGSFNVEEYLHSNKPRILICNCNRSFRNIHNFRKHIQNHANEKLFVCAFCKKSFGNSRALRLHSIIHGSKSRFECEVCKKYFASNANLVAHMIVHTYEKLYKCEFCPKEFGYASSLRKHLLVHPQGRKCNICQAQFASKEELEAHVSEHEIDQNSEMPNKGVSNDKELHEPTDSVHMLKRFGCGVCGLSSQNIRVLRKHAEMHSRRLFVCNLCHIRFDICLNLKDHYMNVHYKHNNSQD